MIKEMLEGLPEDAKKLVDLLGRPERGELNYDGKERRHSRLEALK